MSTGHPAAARRPRSRLFSGARDRAIQYGLLSSGGITLLLSASLLIVLLTASIQFFTLDEVSLGALLFDTAWSPALGATPRFAIWPLLTGTALVASIGLVIAVPLGCVLALWLTEYAPRFAVRFVRPALAVLARVPTVVLGFVAVTLLAPALSRMHAGFESINAASAGIAVGIMLLPFVVQRVHASMAEQSDRLASAAYSLGATRLEVCRHVLLPTVRPMIVSTALLSLSRAVGETMIVALAAGSTPRLTLDPRDRVQTLTGHVAQVFLGDVSKNSAEYLVCYVLALLLLLMTLTLNVSSRRIEARQHGLGHARGPDSERTGSSRLGEAAE